MLDLSISLLSFNNKDLLENCLNSIYKQSFSTNKNTNKIKFEILLVDNASKDGTVEMVKKNFPKVKLIANRQNKLYIKGHNQNLRRVKGRYFLIMNEDIEIKKGTIERMIKFIKSNPRISLASCRQVDVHGKIDPTTSKFPHPLFEIFENAYLGNWARKVIKIKKLEGSLKNYHYASWKRNTIKSVDVLPGSFIIGRSSLLKDVGFLDQNLWFFYGEPDFCKRVKQANFSIVHIGKITITHLKSKAFSQLPPFRRYQISEHDMLTYYKKYYGTIWFAILWLSFRPNWLYWKLKG